MAVPKKKTTRSRKGTRRAHLALKQINFSICPQCKQLVLPHRICSNCGYYKGREVIEVKSKKVKGKTRRQKVKV
jgi:large subunit ribosomal protein L32